MQRKKIVWKIGLVLKRFYRINRIIRKGEQKFISFGVENEIKQTKKRNRQRENFSVRSSQKTQISSAKRQQEFEEVLNPISL